MDDSPYDSLADLHGGEERWAFGTGFDDPLAGVDTAVPADVDPRALARECLALGDDALVLSQRLAQWCSNAPELEDDVAMANIALDLLGQARLLLTRAAHADPGVRPGRAPAHVPEEDALAYFRDADEFTNVALAEVDDEGDFARAIVRLLAMSGGRLATMRRLANSPDPVLAAIAARAVSELRYHVDYASGWALRLDNGTEYSSDRMQAARAHLAPWLAELAHGGDASPGRRGEHTSELAALLADMQSLARALPAGSW